MSALNPFLRAFFRSIIPAQCSPLQNHVLLVPTTESLLNSRDRDTGSAYIDLVSSEEFLGSHVLRISTSPGISGAKDALPARESRGKVKQISTVNGRTVVLKESFVYSNKGFRTLNQAQLLGDVLYYAPNNDSEPWLIYYISKPLIGAYDPGWIPQAVVPGNSVKAAEPSDQGSRRENQSSNSAPQFINSFGEILFRFPMIGREMQPGLDRLFREFGKELGKPLPPPPSPSESAGQRGVSDEDAPSVSSSKPWPALSAGSHDKLPFGSSYLEDDVDIMRRSLETAVTAAIDLFRLVDSQQLSLLGATTDLTGTVVERFIERYVAEQVHNSLLFPRLCACREKEDAELDVRIRRMESIDVSQVGITIEGGQSGKEELIRRLAKGVDEFRHMVDAKSPHAMLDVLLSTVKVITMPPEDPEKDEARTTTEKESSVLTVNADILVSLLLVVVIRSQVRHLQARLLYMQQFLFIEDVESGEAGYALSTLEGVLTYLRDNSAAIRKASSRNKRLWSATKTGNVEDMKSILEPDVTASPDESVFEPGEEQSIAEEDRHARRPSSSSTHMNGRIAYPGNPGTDEVSNRPQTPHLAHVFPFQTWSQNPSDSPSSPPPRKKVSMDTRSLSEVSTVSFLSRSTTAASLGSGIEEDTSIENLSKTQDPAGASVPMMAVEGRQPEALKYLLTLGEYYPAESILEDTNSDGTTLLSAAIQLGHTEIVDIILNFVSQSRHTQDVIAYFKKADVRGRTGAHYIFSAPSLIPRLGSSLPWRQKDKNGQTPLFALCRSYDHPEYNTMVNQGLSAAKEAHGDGQSLRLDDHVDTRGNTLLHIVSDPQIIIRILRECDCDPNATNEKKFTPLMMASKYGRVDLVRIFFNDPRVDVHLREARGFTAIELAKDDDVRNKIDDLILLSKPASSSPSSSAVDESLGRITTVVRSVFVEDATVRFIIKSGAPNISATEPNAKKATTFTITTCRRSLADFENLIKFLRLENPASYIPELPPFRSPFQLYSKPSRAVLHEEQECLDRLLKILLTHPTFSTHELLWEFFLVPEMQYAMIEERSERKAAVMKESIADDYQPVNNEDIRDIEQIITHALDAVQTMSNNTRKLLHNGHTLHHASSDFADAISLCAKNAISSLQQPTNALPMSHINAFNRYAACYANTSPDYSSPLVQFLSALSSAHSTTTAIETTLARPIELITSLHTATHTLARLHSSIASSAQPRKFTLPGMEEARQRTLREQESRVAELTDEINWLGKEIGWTKDVAVGELAGWTGWRERVGREAIKEFARTTVVRERERVRRLERCLRSVKEGNV